MLQLFIALFYGFWFYKAAQQCKGRNPLAWAAIGWLVFAAVSNIISRGTSELYLAMLDNNNLSQTLAYVVTGAIVLAALIAGHGFAVLAWKLFLRKDADAAKNTAARRSIAMPGPFPVYFTQFYVAFAVLGLMLIMLTSLLLLERPGGTIPQGKILMDFGAALFRAGAYSFVLWKCRHWLTIAAGWAVVSTMVMMASLFFWLAQVDASVFPVMSFLPPLVTTFIGMCATQLFVKQWGASLKVLLAGCLAPDLFLELPLTLLTSHNPVSADMIINPLIWSVLMALVLYTSLLAQDGREKAEDASPEAAIAFSN